MLVEEHKMLICESLKSIRAALISNELHSLFKHEEAITFRRQCRDYDLRRPFASMVSTQSLVI